MWLTQVGLQKRFCLGHTFVTKICRLIDAHIDFYGHESKVRKRYSPIAFYHAYQNYDAWDNGTPLTPYEPEKIAKYLIELDKRTAEDYYKEGYRKCQEKMYKDLTVFFCETEVPKDSRQVARALRSGVLAIAKGDSDDELQG